MQEIRIYCDLCQRQISGDYFSLKPTKILKTNTISGHSMYGNIDICLSCAEKFPLLQNNPPWMVGGVLWTGGSLS